eukprot:tig00021435_g21392.t1
MAVSEEAVVAPAASGGMEPEELVRCWIKDQVDKEQMRVEAQGSRLIPMPVKNMGIVREGPRVVNRIEIDTAFDFDKVQQILLSDPIPCPLKPGSNYVHVLLFTEKPIPLLLPYVYDTKVASNNPLTDWVFLNKQLKRSHHRIKGGFQTVGAG